MEPVAVLKRWQSFNPASQSFDLTRTNREYAELIGIHESYLSKCYAGIQPVGLKAFAGLARLFPQAATEVVEAMAGRPIAEVA
jgi:hypothetical protein